MTRILVVDDEPDLLDILGAELRDRGFEVECAANGAEALEHARRARFDLLLTDLKMPGMDGLELLEDLTRAGLVDRAIVMTGFTSDDVCAHVASQGLRHLSKPFDAPELLAALEDELARAPLR
jgi:CheY-like chemotaxis protein